MLQGFPISVIFIVSVFLQLTAAINRESLNYANCQLTNTCYGRTADDLATEGPTTPDITDRASSTLSTQTTLTTSENASPLTPSTEVALHTATEPSTEATPPDEALSTALHTATSQFSTAEQLTKSQTTSEVSEFEKKIATVMTTVDALKSTPGTETPEENTIRLVRNFDLTFCYWSMAITTQDLIYVLCAVLFGENTNIRAYDDSFPHDLLMITIAEDILLAKDIVKIENTSTIYVSTRFGESIWKIDAFSNKVDKWLSEFIGLRYCLSVASENHILVLYYSPDLLYMCIEIYDQDAKLVRNLSLPNSFNDPVHVIQKPNGEFIVSHYLEGIDGIFISFLSADGHLISQFRLREAVGFRDAQILVHDNGSTTFAAEMFNGNVFIWDWDAGDWNLTDLSFTRINSSEDRLDDTARFRCSDGRIFVYMSKTDGRQSVDLFFDADNINVLVFGHIFRNIYQLDTETLNGGMIGQLNRRASVLFYDKDRREFISAFRSGVYIWAIN